MPDNNYNITYVRDRDIIAEQKAAEQQFMEEFNNGSFTIDKPLIKLNPYLISPCSALVLFKTEQKCAVTVTVRGKEAAGDLSHTFPPSDSHILPVLGLYPDFENTVIISLYQGKTISLKIRTEAPSATLPELISMKTTAAHLKNDLIVVSPAVAGAVTGFDYRGDVRFYISIPLQMAVKKLSNGRLLIGSNRIVHPPYFSTGIIELDMCGKIFREYLMPGGYHHDQIELPNGDLIALTEDLSRDTVEDMCALIDRESGAIKKVWDYKSFLTPGEGASGNYTHEDWFHNNAIWYDCLSDSLTLSARHIDAMVNIDFNSGNLNWIIGDPESWPEDKQKYFFKPIGENFDWQYAQHACLVTPSGDIMCFDNGTLRSKIKDNYIKNKDNYSRAVRYKINTDDMTIEQVWQYGKELGSDFFSQHISNVVFLAEHSYLIHSGGKQFFNGQPAESLAPPDPDTDVRREAVTVEIAAGVPVLEMRIASNYYRAVKLPLYDDNSCFSPATPLRLGSLAPTKHVAVPQNLTDAASPLPESCFAHLVEETERFALKSRFEIGQSVFIILTNPHSSFAFPVDTSGARFARMSCIGYIEPDDRNTSTTINKAGLSGDFALSIAIDSFKYPTGLTISC